MAHNIPLKVKDGNLQALKSYVFDFHEYYIFTLINILGKCPFSAEIHRCRQLQYPCHTKEEIASNSSRSTYVLMAEDPVFSHSKTRCSEPVFQVN